MYIPESYRISEIDSKILKPALEELKELEEFRDLYYEKIKKGREVVSLKFVFTKKRADIEYILDTYENLKEKEEIKESREKEAKINFLKNIITEISSEDIVKLLDLTDERNILEKYYLMKSRKNNIDNITGWLIKAIKEDYKIIGIKTTQNTVKEIGPIEKRLMDKVNKSKIP